MSKIYITDYSNIFYWSVNKTGNLELFLEKINSSHGELKTIYSNMDGCLLFTYCHDNGFMLFFPNYVKSFNSEAEYRINWETILKNTEGAWPTGKLYIKDIREHLTPLNEGFDDLSNNDFIEIPHIRLKEFVY